jgi:hypothetical protein
VTLAAGTPAGPLIALISATTSAIGPAAAAFAQEFPEARLWNILDDRLLSDAEDSSGVTPQLAARMERLIQHAVGGGAGGILLTCSQYGFVSRSVSIPVPIQAPDDAAFAEILAGGFGSVLIVASLPSTLADTTARLTAAGAEAGTPVQLDGICPADGAGLVAAGDYARLASTLNEAIRARAPEPDALLLAQYSLAPVAEILQPMTRTAVLSGAACAARRLRAELLHPANAVRSCASAPRGPSPAGRRAD